MNARRSNVTLIYQGKNITGDVSDDLTAASYEEGFGQADLTSLSLQDRFDKWLLGWNPKLGERMKLDINVYDWFEAGDNRRLKCGDFLVDEIVFSGSTSGKGLSLNGNSLPSDSNFIGTPHSRTWKNITIKDQFLSILPDSLTLNWQTKFNINLVYAEQSEMADLEYISNQCKKYGLRLKVLNKKLVVFSARELDAQPPTRTFSREELQSYTLRKTATRTRYDACKVKYQSAAQGKELSFIYPAGGNPPKLYEVSESVYSLAEAEAVAKAALWEQNMVSDMFELALPMGDTSLYAGRNIELVGSGDFDGVYGIDGSAHTVNNSGYATTLQLHKVIRDAAPMPSADINIGDTVNFSGGNHYVASTATEPTGGFRTAGTAKVTNKAPNALHPYHLIGTTSNVYGWVDKSTVSKG